MASKEEIQDFLTIEVLRGGAVDEITNFLTDLNDAYAACYDFRIQFRAHRRLRQGPDIIWELGMMPDLGFDEDYLRQRVWQKVGRPLARLGKHQDNGLISRA